MTIQDGPNPKRRNIQPAPGGNSALWIGGIAAVVAVIGLLVYAAVNSSTTTAERDQQPSTTGSSVTDNARETPSTSGSASSPGRSTTPGPVQPR